MATPRHLLLLAFLAGTALSFAPTQQLHRRGQVHQSTVVLSAGSDAENPFKSPDFLKSKDGAKADVDPGLLLSLRLNGCNLFFIGMMGCGKSAVGKTLARRMGTYSFLDTDDVLEDAVGRKIPQIFADDGEPAFRDIEAQVLDRVHTHSRCLISTGGGLAMQDRNWPNLSTGIVLYLQVDPEVIIERIKGTDRPLLQTADPLQTLKDLMEVRSPKYAKADVVVPVTSDMDLEMTADACIEALHNYVDAHPPAWKQANSKRASDAAIDMEIAKIVTAE